MSDFFGSILNFALGITNALISPLMSMSQNIHEQELTDAANRANIGMNNATNQSNIQIAKMTNAANAEQAELAYRRSQPVNQVFDMMQAGMSKSAALQKIAGGGQYSPAQMIGSTLTSGRVEKPNLDYSGFHNMLRSLSDLPQNSMQMKLQEEQLKSVRQQFEFNLNEERRKQQAHDLAMDEKLYSKWERESMDEFMSLMESRSQDMNVQPKENQSMHDFVRELGLQNDSAYKKLPASARQRAFDHYKQAQEEKRAQLEERRRNEKRSEEHNINDVTYKRLKAELSDFNSAKNAREKEYTARALQAEITALAAERGISREEMITSIEAYRGKDGKLHQKPERSISPTMQNFWNTIFDIIPIGALSDVFFRGLKLGK